MNTDVISHQFLIAGRRTVVLALMIAGLGLTKTVAAADETSLLALVRSDVGLCLEVRQLAPLVADVRASSWWERIRQTQIYLGWRASGDAAKLRNALNNLEKLVQSPTEEFLLGLFGSQVVVAVSPGVESKPIALLLTRVDSEERMAQTLAIWNRAENAQTTERKLGDIVYFLRTRQRTREGRSAEERIFYYSRGRVLAVSESEELVRSAIELSLDKGAGLARNARFEETFAAMPPGAAVRCYAQPQVWLAAAAKPADGAESRIPAWLKSWSRCDAVGAQARFDEGWTIDILADFPPESASSTWRDSLRQSRAIPLALANPPASALVIWSSRIDLAFVKSLIAELVPPHRQRSWKKGNQIVRGLMLGYDPLDDVLPRLGPNVLGWVAPSAGETTKGEWPWQAMSQIALRSPVEVDRSGSGDDRKPEKLPRGELHAALDNALSTGLNLAAAAVNSNSPETTAVARSELLGDLRLRWIDGIDAWKPAVGISPSQITLATSPRAIRDAIKTKSEKQAALPLAAEAAVRRCVADPDHWIYFDLAGMRAALDTHRAFLTSDAFREDRMSLEESERRLNDAIDLLRVFDSMIFAVRLNETRLQATLSGRLDAARASAVAPAR